MVILIMVLAHQVTMSIDGDKYVRHEKGETFDCTWTRSVSGDTMTMVSVYGTTPPPPPHTHYQPLTC